MSRVLLILPSKTYRAEDFTRAAAALGADLVVASDRRQAMSAFLGDRAIVLPLQRPDESAQRIVAHNETTKLDAVVAVDDQGVKTAALAARALNLKTSDPEAVARTRDKSALREALAHADVPQPDFRVAAPGDDIEALAVDLGAPLVVKPLSLSASRGVIRADDPAQAAAAAKRIRAMVPDDEPLLLESYIPGAEVAVEGLLRDGKLETLAIFDKPDPLEGPYFEETIYVTPSRLPDKTQGEIERLTAVAAAAIGLAEGPVHAELRVDGDTITLLELAARSIGGLCARALRFGAGISLEEVILRHALDMPLDDLERADAASGVMMVPIPKAGTLTDVSGTGDAKAVPGIVGVEIAIARGRPVQPLPEGDRYLGFIFARADTPEQAEQALRDAHAKLGIEIDDAGVDPGDHAGIEAA